MHHFGFINEVASIPVDTEHYLFGGQESLVLAINASICSFHRVLSASVHTSNSSKSNLPG